MNHYDYYKAELATKKTIASKKAFLTKSEKSLQSHLSDLLQAKKEGPHGNMKYAYLHGEPVTHIRISKIKTEIKVIQNLKKQIDSIKDQGLKKGMNMKDKVFTYLGKKITKGLAARGETIYTIQGIAVPQNTLTNAKKSIIGDLAAGKVSVLKLKSLKEKVAKISSLKDLQAEIVKINNAPKTMKNQGLKKPTVKGLKTVCSHVVKATGLKVDGTLKKGYKYIAGGKIVKVAATKKTVAKKKPATKKKAAKK